MTNYTTMRKVRDDNRERREKKDGLSRVWGGWGRRVPMWVCTVSSQTESYTDNGGWLKPIS